MPHCSGTWPRAWGMRWLPWMRHSVRLCGKEPRHMIVPSSRDSLYPHGRFMAPHQDERTRKAIDMVSRRHMLPSVCACSHPPFSAGGCRSGPTPGMGALWQAQGRGGHPEHAEHGWPGTFHAICGAIMVLVTAAEAAHSARRGLGRITWHGARTVLSMFRPCACCHGIA